MKTELIPMYRELSHMENTLSMMKNRKVILPYYFQMGKSVRQVSLKNVYRRWKS